MSLKSLWTITLMFFLASIGCAGESGPTLNPVEGIVEIEGGGTATQGQVVMTSTKTTATGNIGADGKFKMGTTKDGDGVPVGDYQVTVMGTSTGDYTDRKRVIDEKYEAAETSGLKFKVEAKSNNCPLKLAKPVTK